MGFITNLSWICLMGHQLLQKLYIFSCWKLVFFFIHRFVWLMELYCLARVIIYFLDLILKRFLKTLVVLLFNSCVNMIACKNETNLGCDLVAIIMNSYL